MRGRVDQRICLNRLKCLQAGGKPGVAHPVFVCISIVTAPFNLKQNHLRGDFLPIKNISLNTDTWRGRTDFRQDSTNRFNPVQNLY